MRVLTLNLRQDLDRWPERLPLVVHAVAEADADVVAFQEVALSISQDRLLADALRELGPAYAVHTAPKWGDQDPEGVSLLTRLPARDHQVLALPGDGGRVAQRVVVRLPGGTVVTVVNTHLHHLPLDDESVRRPQAEALLAWLEDDGLLERCVLLGDLNSAPASATLDAAGPAADRPAARPDADVPDPARQGAVRAGAARPCAGLPRPRGLRPTGRRPSASGRPDPVAVRPPGRGRRHHVRNRATPPLRVGHTCPVRPHPTFAGLTEQLDHLRAAPAQIGTVELVIRRPATGEREILDEGVLDEADGMVGDNWLSRATSHAIAAGRHLDAQINVMSARMVALLADTPEGQAQAGDQLYLDLDISVANLPTGSRIALGETAVVEVSAKPHAGCKKFTGRFGEDAMRFVNSEVGRELRLRGFNARVVTGGVVRPGDKAIKL